MTPSRRWPVISALGVIQILTWGSSFYLLSVLAAPMSKDTGWPLGWVIGGLSLGLLVAGLVSPRVGAFIGEHGGRPVLAFAAVILAGLIQVVLGSATMPVANLMKLGRGAIVPLDHRVGEPVDVTVNGRVVARAEEDLGGSPLRRVVDREEAPQQLPLRQVGQAGRVHRSRSIEAKGVSTAR